MVFVGGWRVSEGERGGPLSQFLLQPLFSFILLFPPWVANLNPDIQFWVEMEVSR